MSDSDTNSNSAPNPSHHFEGTWKGWLEPIGYEMSIQFSRRNDGKLAGIVYSRSSTGVPFSKLTVKARTIHGLTSTTHGVFRAIISEDEQQIQGVWILAGKAYPILLKPIEQYSPPAPRSQEPVHPYPYKEESVSFACPEGPNLSGTLTHPSSQQACPAVVLVHGSGANDRNEQAFWHKPFLVLADHLTRQGFAVLRYDKRGVGASAGRHASSTTLDYADDALAAVEFLKSHPAVNPQQIGLIGHSEGGIVAPLVASKSPDLAFIISLGGPAVPGDQLMSSQVTLILRAMGVTEDIIARDLELKRKQYAILKSDCSTQEVYTQLKLLLSPPDKPSAADPDQEEQYEILEGILQLLVSPWWRFFICHDPRPALTRVHCPVLALIGEKDLQVPPGENLSAMAEALSEAGNSNVTLLELPSINHMFQKCQSGSPDEYGEIEETINPSVLVLLTTWLRSTLRPS